MALDWTPNIKPVSVGESNPSPRTICKASGWGLTNKEQLMLLPNPDLMEIDIEILSNDVCYQSFSWLLFDDTNICGFGRKGCTSLGDSGGPLICKNQISGIISFGKKYDCVGSEIGFTSMQFYHKWILYIILSSEEGKKKKRFHF
ncbi:hypothetical protein HHI36_017815 [Cryptolaemus montrouzieri]|uniref:Peptidase S1 domain-containing protein n=1 Tax=Cryptolaemus montrouzieri TaxID=559131 RepID=A0ABD2NNJ7_9CUCU